MLRKYGLKCHFITEQIRDANDNLCGVEVLTRFEKKTDNDAFFSDASVELKMAILLNQLIQIEEKRNFFVKNDIVCSVNIDHDIMEKIIFDAQIDNLLKKNKFIRLELSEKTDLNDSDHRKIIQLLTEKHTLWLDDFGEKGPSLEEILSLNIKTIKIDKTFFWKEMGTGSFKDTINTMFRLNAGVIIEGVESDKHLRAIKRSFNPKIWMQGYLFNSFPLMDIEKIPIKSEAEQ